MIQPWPVEVVSPNDRMKDVNVALLRGINVGGKNKLPMADPSADSHCDSHARRDAQDRCK
jgi:hypothetical protein